MNAVAGIQARTSSTRLPGKVLADVAGAPLIVRVVERARAAKRLDEVVVLTSTEASDDQLAEELERRGIPVRRGSLPDVLSRYEALVNEFDPRYVVRITGDCPLLEGAIIDLQLEALAAHDGDFTLVRDPRVDNTLGGQSAFSVRALRMAFGSTDPLDREHVGSFYFRRHGDALRFVELDVDPRYLRDQARLCVDQAPDLEVVRRVFEALVPEHGPCFPLLTALAWLDEHPELTALNRDVEHSADNQKLKRMTDRSAPDVVGRWP